jgi:uncharacterized protein (DUF952 family)
MSYIFHITQRGQWEKAKILGNYRCNTLDTEGFIHCSTARQLVNVANRFFTNQQDLVLLFIDTNQVQAAIRYELAEINELFPHIYGELNLNAVFQVIDFVAGEDGYFKLPLEVRNLPSEETQNQDVNVREYVKQMSALLDLEIKDEYIDGVVTNFERIRSIAQLINEFPLSEDLESASLFTPEKF